MLSKTAVDCFVCAVAVQEHTAVRLSVKQLGKTHSHYFVAVALTGTPSDFDTVYTCGGCAVKGHSSLCKVCSIADSCTSNGNNRLDVRIGELEGLSCAIGGEIGSALIGEEVYSLQFCARAIGCNGCCYHGDVALYYNGCVLAVPAIVFRACKDVQLVRKAEEKGFVTDQFTLVFGYAIGNIPQKATTGGYKVVLAGNVTFPHTKYRTFVVQFGIDTVAGSNLQVVFACDFKVAHFGGFAHLHIGVAVGVFVQSKPLLDLIHFAFGGAFDFSH